jgi:hypothetical protein
MRWHYDVEDQRLVVRSEYFQPVPTGADLEVVIVAAEIVNDADVPAVDVHEGPPWLDIQLQPANRSTDGRCRLKRNRVVDRSRRPEPGGVERN